MNGQVFWAIVCGFFAGVFLRSFETSAVASLFTMLVGSIALALAYFRRTRMLAFPLTLALIAAGVGLWRMDSASISYDPTLAYHVGQQVVLEGEVSAEPDVREKSVLATVIVNDIAMHGIKTPVSARVLVMLPAQTSLVYGEQVRVIGKLTLPASFDTGVNRQFDYPSYLAAQGISFTLAFATLEKVEPGTGNPLKAFAIGVKQAFLRGLKNALPEPSAAFAGGITVGDKRSIGAALTKDFQIAGLIHMLVLSGYNITVVLNAAAWTLARTPFLNAIRVMPLASSGGIVVFFVLMSGGAASAARAGIMALVAVLARFSRREFLASRALAAAAVLLVIWNPYILCFDPGFQLSALATLGLITFTPLISKRLLWVPVRGGLREIAASTLATQIAVLPLLLYQNGQISMYALPANLLTLPLMPYAMFASLLAGVFGLISSSFGIIVGLPAYFILSYIIVMTEFIARLPYSSLSLPAFSAWWLAPVYGALIGVSWYLTKLSPKKNEAPKGEPRVPRSNR